MKQRNIKENLVYTIKITFKQPGEINNQKKVKKKTINSANHMLLELIHKS